MTELAVSGQDRQMDTGQIIPISRHCCPACGRPMQLISSVSRFGSFPELRTFECKSCGITYTEAAKPADRSETRARK